METINNIKSLENKKEQLENEINALKQSITENLSLLIRYHQSIFDQINHNKFCHFIAKAKKGKPKQCLEYITKHIRPNYQITPIIKIKECCEQLILKYEELRETEKQMVKNKRQQHTNDSAKRNTVQNGRNNSKNGSSNTRSQVRNLNVFPKNISRLWQGEVMTPDTGRGNSQTDSHSLQAECLRLSNTIAINHIIKKGFEIYEMEKDIHDPHYILNYGLNTYSIIPTYLLNKHVIDSNPDLREKLSILKLDDLVKNYEIIYKKYIDYYNRLFKWRKESQNETIAKYPRKHEYWNKLGSDRAFDSPKAMVTPEELKKLINKNIINRMDEYNTCSLLFNDTSSINTGLQVAYNITRYMDEKEIRSLYQRIKVTLTSYQGSDDQLHRVKHNLAIVIMHRKYSDELDKINSDEKRAEYIKEKLSEICLETFDELLENKSFATPKGKK